MAERGKLKKVEQPLAIILRIWYTIYRQRGTSAAETRNR